MTSRLELTTGNRMLSTSGNKTGRKIPARGTIKTLRSKNILFIFYKFELVKLIKVDVVSIEPDLAWWMSCPLQFN